MSTGIARKLRTTYFIIVLATVVSGICCLYVLSVNLHSNTEMRTVTLPSLDHLKEMRLVMQNLKKLTNSWVYIAGNRDKGRLEYIVNVEYPGLDSSLSGRVFKWQVISERQSYATIHNHNNHVVDSAKKIMAILSKPEFYTNDPVVDYAVTLNSYVDSLVRKNDNLFAELIDTKEQNLIKQQHHVNYLLHSLYIIILFTILVVIIVSVIAARYSSKKIVKPIVALDRTMLEMAVGKVVPVKEVKRKDEIGQMQTSVNKMIAGILQKIDFAEQIGKGNYDADFTLLSSEDKFGIALQTMRDDLRRSNQALIEQDRRLVDAQKLARIGNYYYDFETGEVQTSSTLDDILGIGKSFPKRMVSWKDHILPGFHTAITSSAIAAIKQHTKFVESYIIKRYGDGKESWVTAIGEYNYDEKGRAFSMFGTIQDVTESKLLEIELNNAYNIAREQNNRLLNFSYIVSHNLRMHAVNIHGLLGMLNDASYEEERTQYINYLFTASAKLDETLHHLNDVVAMQHTLDTQKVPVTLSNVVANTIGALKTSISDKQAKIISNIPDGILIDYNPVYIDSILLNLLSNAIKYSSPLRHPVVSLSCYKYTDKDALGYWVLEIADNGMGIDLDMNGEKLFGMYKTFHGNKDARGVGLFMTKYQVEAMGGRITVESKVNEGSIFRVYIKQ